MPRNDPGLPFDTEKHPALVMPAGMAPVAMVAPDLRGQPAGELGMDLALSGPEALQESTVGGTGRRGEVAPDDDIGAD